MPEDEPFDQNSKSSFGMDPPSRRDLDQKMCQWFQRFGGQAAASPMYQFLSTQVSQDVELIELAKDADPRQPAPNLFFAAVHFLLMQNSSEELSRHYPSFGGSFTGSEVVFASFKRFCLKFRPQISQILKTRLVQTNEVQRCALLLPAVHFVSQNAGNSQIALVDVGASCGLNFLMDRAFIKYTDGQSLGPKSSALQLCCESKGVQFPKEGNVKIVDRIGVDLNPINLLSETERQWNLALIWPDQIERIERFKSALQILDSTPITFVKGNGNEVLPQIASNVSRDHLLCVMHSFTLNQFSKEDREVFNLRLTHISNDREVWRISLEWIGTTHPEVLIAQYKDGEKKLEQRVAECGAHGEWIKWLI